MSDNDLIRRGDAVRVLLKLARIGTIHAPNAGRAFKAAADVVKAIKPAEQNKPET